MLISGKLHPLSQMNWDQSPVLQRLHKSTNSCGGCRVSLWCHSCCLCLTAVDESWDQKPGTVYKVRRGAYRCHCHHCVSQGPLRPLKQFRRKYWLHGESVGVILDLNCSGSLSPVDNSLNLQIHCGWRSCDVEVFTLKCMSSVQQEKYLVQIKLLNHHLLLVHDGTGTQSWLEACSTQLLTHRKHLLMAAYYYKVYLLYLWIWFIRDYLKFRNNFLNTSALFLNIFPTSLALVFTTAKVRIESRRVPYLIFFHSKYNVFKETGGNFESFFLVPKTRNRIGPCVEYP